MLRLSITLVLLCILASMHPLGAFRKSPSILSNSHSRSQLYMQQQPHQPSSAKSEIQRSVIGQIKGLGVSLATMGLFVQQSGAVSVEEVNTKLSGYGFPPVLFVPKGFSPLASEYGRGNINEAMNNPILVQFCHPSAWVVMKTSVNVNGEAGTISANDYMKGDSAYLYVLPVKDSSRLSVTNNALIRTFVQKALSQKGDLVEGLKIYKVVDGFKSPNDQPYVLVDFSYQVNTGAGFLVPRRAILSLTQVGDALQGLVAVTTEKRWGLGGKKGLEDSLRAIAESFRVYRLNSGIFASDPIKK